MGVSELVCRKQLPAVTGNWADESAETELYSKCAVNIKRCFVPDLVIATFHPVVVYC